MSANKINVNFLSDQPLKSDGINQAKFGHEGIAETINDIVLECPTPFTIGLFGKWGTGKSTIINFLQDKLDQKGVIVINFDVWKYQKDSLRRAFLLSMEKTLKEKKLLKDSHSLEERLYQPLTITSDGETRFSWKRLKVLIPYLIGSYFVTLFVLILLKGAEDATSILVESLIIPILLALLQDVKNVVVTDQRSDTYNPIESPEQFEVKFKEMLEYSKGKKMAIVIDNLDRCSHDKAIELLSTIKTFLEVPNNENRAECVFIILCDDDAIKEHLENVYGESNESTKEKNAFDPDEFLRKFFNTFVRIPGFIDTELLNYTEELLEETKAKKLDTPEVAHVITSAFRENPRQIKQFINILLAHYLFVQEREEGKNPLIIPKGAVTDNLSFLAKLLVIRQKSPKAYRKIVEEKYDSVGIDMLGGEYSELKEFLNSTKLIPRKNIYNIRPFIYLKQAEVELRIPDVEELRVALLDNKQDFINEKFKKTTESPELFKDYERFVINLLKENEYRTDSLFNIVLSSLTALKNNNLEFQSKNYYNQVAELLSNDLSSQLRMFNPSLVFDQVIDKCDRRLVSIIVSQYIDLLNVKNDEKKTFEATEKWTYELFQEIVNRKDLFKNMKKEISKALSDIYYSDTKILSLFKGESDIQKDFISEDVLSKFISTLSGNDIEGKDDLNDKIQLLLDFKDVVTPNVIKDLISRFSELLKDENKQPFRDAKENLLSNIETILDMYQEHITKIDDKVVLVPFGELVVQGMNAIGNWNQKIIFVVTCLRLKYLLPDPNKVNIDTPIINFWTNTDSEGADYVLSRLDNEEKDKVFNDYNSQILTKATLQEAMFNTFWSSLTNEKRQDLFRHIINSAQYSWGLSKLEESNYKIGFNKKELVSILLNIAKGASAQNKDGFYKAINAMKCGNDTKLRDNYSAQLKTLLKDSDPSSQEVGYNALREATYLSETNRRDIARETIESLKQLSPVNYTHQFSIRSVALNWDILQSTPKNDYIDIIFDKLIKGSTDENDIKLGLDIIQKIKPKYEEYKPYFDDVIVRIEKEENDDIKREIKNGLLKIKPRRLNKNNSDFWERLEEI